MLRSHRLRLGSSIGGGCDGGDPAVMLGWTRGPRGAHPLDGRVRERPTEVADDTLPIEGGLRPGCTLARCWCGLASVPLPPNIRRAGATLPCHRPFCREISRARGGPEPVYPDVAPPPPPPNPPATTSDPPNPPATTSDPPPAPTSGRDAKVPSRADVRRAIAETTDEVRLLLVEHRDTFEATVSWPTWPNGTDEPHVQFSAPRLLVRSALAGTKAPPSPRGVAVGQAPGAQQRAKAAAEARAALRAG